MEDPESHVSNAPCGRIVGKPEMWSALSPLGDCARITAHSEEILPLSEEREATGPFNALSRR